MVLIQKYAGGVIGLYTKRARNRFLCHPHTDTQTVLSRGSVVHLSPFVLAVQHEQEPLTQEVELVVLS
jgi:hypothetical protein